MWDFCVENQFWWDPSIFEKIPHFFKNPTFFEENLRIIIFNSSCSRSCNFLTRRDLLFIFGYVVGVNMNFTYK